MVDTNEILGEPELILNNKYGKFRARFFLTIQNGGGAKHGILSDFEQWHEVSIAGQDTLVKT